MRGLKRLPLTLFAAFFCVLALSQDNFRNGCLPKNSPAPGDVFITWGYNRASYNPSDIHFKGDDFDFTMYDVYARDMPEPFDSKVYFGITQLTIPQFNFRAGLFITDRSSVSIGWDHMKYRLIDWQRIVIDGYIDPDHYPDYGGNFREAFTLLDPAFMKMEHSDGLNYIRIAYEYRLPVWHSNNGKTGFSLVGSACTGLAMPWTDWTFNGERYRNKPHIAGFGFSGVMAARFEFLNYLFVQFQMQHGWLNMPDIMIQDDASSTASQQIVFQERSWSLGGYIPLFRKSFTSEPGQ